MQQKALVDLDQLISQHNTRQIYNDKLRFIAASALYPERQAQLKKILDQMQVIETAIIQAGEIEKRGDYAGRVGNGREGLQGESRRQQTQPAARQPND